MSAIKNEHLVWAYGERTDGTGQVVVLGLTDQGLDYLRAGVGEDKRTLVVNPSGNGFTNITQIVVFHEHDKETLKQRLREAGWKLSAAH